MRDRGWVEFTVYPLFSPQSLIAEGTANFGIEMAFPGRERIAFEEAVIFPAAGIDPARADEYYEVQALVEQLAYAGNEAARAYINGQIDGRRRRVLIEKYALMRRIAPGSACGSSTSTAATSSTTTSARTWSARYIESRARKADSSRRDGRSSAGCCRRRACRRGCSSGE